ncbi:hypothetical protein PN509_18240 [Nodularia spumigena CS-588/02]|uniref:hypothetical protein n=1 Tax=Nodularia spumigena TaxID=70799 RepID=UPI00232D97AB|nr:hypothetical protein [Nodularia spumigena]MDB9349031.1 hypothetical protein [Nodularia spumigena CS-588/01]MDB9350630.1 hypothetical protein [Nodularia spumigena CS-588/05]MDB9362228.1 hypothetical protein [Nodularia spumigena CS-588/02]MDB9367197.1 hypothetical protein [Nodularia spumigena CS-588/02A10]
MAEPLLTDVFGATATQTETQLIINKADLVDVGLTASATNTAESLFVSLQMKARQSLTEANFQLNTEQNLYYSDGFPSFITKGETAESWRVEQISWNIASPNTGVSLNPNDY